eukprot:6804412-Pyramimonas_sp.AAC.1
MRTYRQAGRQEDRHTDRQTNQTRPDHTDRHSHIHTCADRRRANWRLGSVHDRVGVAMAHR